MGLGGEQVTKLGLFDGPGVLLEHLEMMFHRDLIEACCEHAMN